MDLERLGTQGRCFDAFASDSASVERKQRRSDWGLRSQRIRCAGHRAASHSNGICDKSQLTLGRRCYGCLLDGGWRRAGRCR
jgi:hypothetical protein